MNVASLEARFENLHQFLSDDQMSVFDVINITETAQKAGENFKINVNLKGYNLFTTETNSIRGGTAIYINDKYDSFERHYLKIREEDFEAVWIEIKNKHGKNTVCGCIYHHSRYDMVNFLNYVDKVLNILNTENKEIHISSNFNTDFLKLESNNSYHEFYNLITSCGLLPQILLPTRVTANSVTVIDNIFTNTLRIGSISSNLLFSISDHFAQFFSINKNNISLKKKRKYTKWSLKLLILKPLERMFHS